MAQEADGPELPSRLDARLRGRTPDGESKLPRGSSPADTLISPRLWKHGVVGLLCSLAWLGVLLIGRSADQTQQGWESIVGLTAGKLTTFFSTVMLLAAGQLAFINLWYRSRSRKDFNGSYKLWFYAAVGWLAMCAFRATGAHWSLADAVLAGRPMAIWNGRMIVWLIPAAIVFVSLYVLLRREMRDCRESLWMLRLTGLTAFANGLTLLVGQFCLTTGMQLFAEAGLSMGWQMLLAWAMLLHARHVIHVCNEPPQSPIQRWHWRDLLPGWPGKRSVRAVKVGKSPGSEKRTSATKSGKSAVKRSTTRRKSAADLTDAVGLELDADAENCEHIEEEAVAVAVPTPVASQNPASATAVAKNISSAPITRRVDPPQSAPLAKSKPHFTASASTPANAKPPAAESVDDVADSDDEGEDDDGGLSKKDRRRLKKLQRQQARSSR